MSKTIMTVALTVVILSLFLYGVHASNPEENQLAKTEVDKEIVSTSVVPPPKTPTVRKHEATVYSFYDTQLEMVCYVATTGIDCVRKDILSSKAKMFIDDRLAKAKDDVNETVGKVGGATIIPRIVSLDK